MSKKVTMQMIADSLGISKVSVSKALGNGSGVSEKLRERVLASAREMGYEKQSRVGAKSIRQLSFIEPKRYFLDSDDFFTQVYYHLLQLCTSMKIQLHHYVVGEQEEQDLTPPFPIAQNLMDGILIGGEFHSKYLEAIKSYKIPTVAIGFYELHNDIDSVIVDDYYNANQLANALVEMGFDEIGYLGDVDIAHSALDRYYGYVKALRENKLQYNEEWVISDVDEHGHVITDYQLPEKPPKAFLCHSDFAAYHLTLKIKKRGLKVPKDVAIAAFDNTDKTEASGCAIGLDITGLKFAEVALRQIRWRHKNPDHEHQRVIINAPLVFLQR